MKRAEEKPEDSVGSDPVVPPPVVVPGPPVSLKSDIAKYQSATQSAGLTLLNSIADRIDAQNGDKDKLASLANELRAGAADKLR